MFAHSSSDERSAQMPRTSIACKKQIITATRAFKASTMQTIKGMRSQATTTLFIILLFNNVLYAIEGICFATMAPGCVLYYSVSSTLRFLYFFVTWSIVQFVLVFRQMYTLTPTDRSLFDRTQYVIVSSVSNTLSLHDECFV